MPLSCISHYSQNTVPKMETRDRRRFRKYTRGGKIQQTENNPTVRGRTESSSQNCVRKKHYKTRKTHEGVISKHQYGRSHKTCISPAQKIAYDLATDTE
jgi:hypothetical protein